jgi:Ran GTPase-activating protein (RanGAP) involved in mRNA processing and transport
VLSKNQIKNEGCSHIQKLLAHENFSRLMHLELEDNNIEDAGAELLFKALRTNKSVQKVNLSHNLLTGRCGEAIR